ncbi:efflux transporter outer membrane subunit [Brenneria tiliae]|uniref:Efflux transporter outer membrane subunit n=1 Tax=Brenneria tiliae TaxID=2914984 RepID=A0ABT0MY22_9GAMM|nr:efflux transporter outer membrane subunit [Brenneria tiliae]MCL2894750.1 efflux transporter outer membrane subunit [Brenneria tiliae]
MMRRPLSIGALALLLSACATSPSPQKDALSAAPAAWRADAPPGDVVQAGWWRAFGDPRLTAAVERALAGNTDLAVAEARIREAEALAVQARSALLPSLNGSISAQDARSLSAATGRASTSTTVQPQLQAAYEVDLWGRVRASDNAARAALQASRYARDAAALSVAAATARAYVQLASLDAQSAVARDTLASRNESLRVATQRAQAGYTSRLELAQAEVEQRAAARRIPELELAVRQQENALRLLTGETPGAVERSRFATLAVPTPAPGLPSALLARRPDIAQSEAELLSADATFASERAALLPQVSLTASIGRLFVEHIDPVTVWNLGGSLLAPLFDGGRLAAQADAAEARRDQAAWAYRAVVLNAFAETENALEGVVRLQSQSTEAAAQRAAVAEALKHARNRYRAGYASYLEELDAQRGLFNSEVELIQLRQSRLLNAVTLYQALGGGWSAPAG